MRWWRERRGRLGRLLVAGVLASLGVTAASAVGYLEPLQTRALDLLLWLQGQRQPAGVVVIGIDDAAFERLGRVQPLSRDYLARVVRGALRGGAAVVGLDVTLAGATRADHDAAVARAVLEGGDGDAPSRVVLVETGTEGPLSDPALRRIVMRASSSVPVDADGVVRHVALAVPGPAAAVPALGLAVVARLGGLDQAALDRALAAGTVHLPARSAGADRGDAGGAVDVVAGELQRINFAGPAGTFLTIPSDAVAALAEPEVPIARDTPLRDRVVLVGATFRDSRDVHPTPHGPMPGVEVHANVAHMLLTRSLIRPAGWTAAFGLQVLVVLLAAPVFLGLRPLPGLVVCAAGALLVAVPASRLALGAGGYWVDFVLPVLATCGLGVVADVAERRRVRAAFDRYVSPEIGRRIRAEAPGLRGERREVSVLFSDLRGFTTMSETLSAEQVATRLNEYFPAMTEAIFAHGGTINDFIGDAVMAIFGAPLDDPDHALNAVRSALAMERALAALNARWAADGVAPLRMGIGVHSGPVFAGNVGGRARMKYTVVGDTVNVGARVEGLNKELGTTILITEETYARIGPGVDAEDRGAMVVKGRARPVRVYAVRGDRPGGEAR
ncbi:MAG: CHASE2 domain-containing protein [Candidatus Rokuibacteriota bacterium]